MREVRERWDARYRAGAGAREPDPFLAAAAAWRTEPGRALDLAGGAGRHALALARAGWRVTLADGSPYLVLELLHGEGLDDRIARGPLSWDETVHIARQIGWLGSQDTMEGGDRGSQSGSSKSTGSP